MVFCMKSALVLEGGSLRCMFSAGITDVLLEQGTRFDGVFGTSSGSLTGISVVAGQIGRTKRVNLDFAMEKEYLGYYSLLKNRSVFNFNYMFNEISDIYLPLDRKKFEDSSCDFTATATSCRTGQTVYYNKHSCPNIYTAVTAGSSMPLLSPVVDVAGEPCLDGGISDAIPFQKALDEGYDKVVVVATRQHGFLKPNTPSFLAEMYVRRYGRYPEFVKTLLETPRMYSRQMGEIDRLVRQKRIFVLRPEFPVEVSRMERDTSKLIALYEEGRRIAGENLEKLRDYLAD